MAHRLRHRLTFSLERWMQRGALYQLMATALAIVAVTVVGGLVVWVAGAIGSPAEALWWAFLRLTDPGYLGDDAGTLLRVVSTAITILGYVLFMGSLIAIMTQWLDGTMRRLELGLTPIVLRDHVLILGWTNRTPAIVEELHHAEGRVRRFLEHLRRRRLRVVILVDEVTPAMRQEVSERLGHRRRALRSGRQVLLRSGSPLRVEHLQRVAFQDAAAILLPGADFTLGGAEATDARVVKTLLSLEAGGDAGRRPTVVAEVFDAQRIPIARQAYGGPIEIVAGDAFISRLIAQNVRHPGLSYVYGELLSHRLGSEAYVREVPAFDGMAYGQAATHFERAVPLGFVRPARGQFRSYLNPDPDYMLEARDRLVLLAQSYDDTAPAPSTAAETRRRQTARAALPRTSRAHPRCSVLILGWSHKAAALVREFAGYAGERYHIRIMSMVPAAAREASFARQQLDTSTVSIEQVEGDYTLRADLAAARPLEHDNVVFLGSDWMDSPGEADARTILGHVLLRSMVPPNTVRPQVLVELLDATNARLFAHRTGEVIVSPVVLSHVLAHVALRRELNVVFSELFGSGGAEIFFRSPEDYDLVDTEVDFRQIQRGAAHFGETALGMSLHAQRDQSNGGVILCPPPDARWTLAKDDRIVVLTTT